MAFDRVKIWRNIPVWWLIGAMLTAYGAGYCYALNISWWILLAICSIACGLMMTKDLMRLNSKMRYVVDATINSDFSYKFPTVNVNKEERESNLMLNRIVEHLEKLTNEARQNEAFIACVINLTEIGIAVADAKGDIRHHNEAALRLLERHALTNICQISEQAYKELEIKKNYMTLNGKSFTLFTISDLSRQKQVAEVESWEKLTRVLTHEIMNSLTPVQSIAETMCGKATTNEMAEALDTISSSSRSLMQFVKNFRKFSILPEPQMRVSYLKPILETCVRMAESYAGEKDIDIRVMCFPPEMMVYTDEALLSQVLLNIVKNAIEANPHYIHIDANVKADESVEISVSNDGEPITDETANHIFTPFFTTRSSGSGIGLSLSRRIVTHLGGTLTFKTRPDTCFIVRL